MRQRVREWQRCRAWMKRVLGCPWPRSCQDLLDYVDDRVAEPCCRTRLREFAACLTFIEAAAEVEEISRYSQHPGFINFMEVRQLDFASGIPGAEREKRKASEGRSRRRAEAAKRKETVAAAKSAAHVEQVGARAPEA